MSDKPENRYTQESAACGHIQKALEYFTLNNMLIPAKEVQGTHHVGKSTENKDGTDITIVADGYMKTKYDVKCSAYIRDHNCTCNTVLAEMGTYMYDDWYKGWLYEADADKIAWVIPTDKGYENLDMRDFIILIADRKNIVREINSPVNEDNVVAFCKLKEKYLIDLCSNSEKASILFAYTDDETPLKMTYETKTDKPDGLLAIVPMDLITEYIIVVKDDVVTEINYNGIEAFNTVRKECSRYRLLTGSF